MHCGLEWRLRTPYRQLAVGHGNGDIHTCVWGGGQHYAVCSVGVWGTGVCMGVGGAWGTGVCGGECGELVCVCVGGGERGELVCVCVGREG